MKEPSVAARLIAPIAAGCLFPWLLGVILGMFVEHLSLPVQEYASRAHKLAIPFWVSWVASLLVSFVVGYSCSKALSLVAWVFWKAEFVAFVVAASMAFAVPLLASGTDWRLSGLLALPNLAAALLGVLLGSRLVGAGVNAA